MDNALRVNEFHSTEQLREKEAAVGWVQTASVLDEVEKLAVGGQFRDCEVDFARWLSILHQLVSACSQDL